MDWLIFQCQYQKWIEKISSSIFTRKNENRQIRQIGQMRQTRTKRTKGAKRGKSDISDKKGQMPQKGQIEVKKTFQVNAA